MIGTPPRVARNRSGSIWKPKKAIPDPLLRALMERIFAATEDGYYFLPKEATGNPLLGKKIEAMIPAAKSDAAGSHHQEMTTPDGLPEHRVGAVGALPVVEAREPMHDDSGAQTGFRRRPDYGESDSLTGSCKAVSSGTPSNSGKSTRKEAQEERSRAPY